MTLPPASLDAVVFRVRTQADIVSYRHRRFGNARLQEALLLSQKPTPARHLIRASYEWPVTRPEMVTRSQNAVSLALSENALSTKSFHGASSISKLPIHAVASVGLLCSFAA